MGPPEPFGGSTAEAGSGTLLPPPADGGTVAVDTFALIDCLCKGTRMQSMSHGLQGNERQKVTHADSAVPEPPMVGGNNGGAVTGGRIVVVILAVWGGGLGSG